MRLFAIIICLIFGVSMPVYAEKASPLLYLSPKIYQLHGHLNSPYREYWFNQAALFEPVAMQALQEKFPALTKCQSGATGSRIIKLIPDVFYNPQMQVLHGKVIANVYSGGGTLLGAYVGKSQQAGMIDVAVEKNIQKAYAAALQDLLKNLSLSPQVYEVESEVKLPCHVVGAQEEPQNGLY